MRARRTVRRLAVGLTAVALLGLTAGPAGAAATPEEWADGFCTASNEWFAGAEAGVAQLQALGDDPTTTPKDGKDFLVEFFGTGVAATKDYAKAVKALGAPDVPKGEKIQATVLAGIEDSAARLAKLRTSAKGLPTKSERKLQRAGGKLIDEFAEFVEPWAKALAKAEKLDTTGELDAAFLSEPSCAPLSS